MATRESAMSVPGTRLSLDGQGWLQGKPKGALQEDVGDSVLWFLTVPKSNLEDKAHLWTENKTPGVVTSKSGIPKGKCSESIQWLDFVQEASQSKLHSMAVSL
jgi:hypothetical protein